MPRLTISLPDETSKELRRLSQVTTINVSALCNIALMALLREPEKVIGATALAKKDQG